MSDAASNRLSVAIAAAIGVITVAGAVLVFWSNRSVLYGNDEFLWSLFTATAIAYTVAGVAIVRRSNSQVIGWLCLVTAASLELSLTLSHYGIYAIGVSPGALPAPALVLAFAEPSPLIYLTGLVLILHLFPSGHPVGRRWRLLVAASVVGLISFIAHAWLIPHRITDIWSDELSHAGVSAANPLGMRWATSVFNVLGPIGSLLVVVGAIGAVVSLFVRRRRASVEERQQIRWLSAVAGASLAWIVLVLPIAVLTDKGNGPAAAIFWLVITPLVALGPPIAIGIGIVRYRLFDIDVVIRKTVVVAVIAFALTALYLGVVALATLAPVSRAPVAALLLVLTFNPIRRAARAIADRAAYGRRASSYEVLSGFSERISETYAADDVLPRMATILASSTGATEATVWLRVGDTLRPEATSGVAERSPHRVVLIGDTLPPLERDAVEVRHNGELLGALSVEMPANDPLDPARRKLIGDMASQAGLVLRNVRLIEELRASRQRLVAAQDEERRRIERNIHDGAQQQLVALSVKHRLLAGVIGVDDDRARAMVEQLLEDTNDALQNLRDLARGIYPPLLADKGLPDALAAQARKIAVPIEISTNGTARYPQEVEAAIYFCVLEALQNVTKYAKASKATVRIESADGILTFVVADDGVGFDTQEIGKGTGLQGMTDRVEALGGSVQLDSHPGSGTTVTGRVPARTEAPGG